MGNGDSLDIWLIKICETLCAGCIGPTPDDQLSIEEEFIGRQVPLSAKTIKFTSVCGEEQIDRCSFANLLGQGPGGAKVEAQGRPARITVAVTVGLCEVLQGIGQTRRGREDDRFLRGRRAAIPQQRNQGNPVSSFQP